MALGPAVVEYLPEKAEGDREFEERLARIREKCVAHARGGAIVKGVEVNAGSAYTSEELWAEIEKQTGNKIVDYRGRLAPAVRLKLDLKNMDFWLAMDSILDMSGVNTFSESGSDGLGLVDNGGPRMLSRAKGGVYVGPLRLDVHRITEERSPNFDGPMRAQGQFED